MDCVPASVTFSKGMLGTQNLGRVLSRGTSLRGSRSSLLSSAWYKDVLAGRSLSGQAFALHSYPENYRWLSSNPQHTYYCSIELGSCNQALLTGYWVGPDTDDGWGFVEAWISQTS